MWWLQKRELFEFEWVYLILRGRSSATQRSGNGKGQFIGNGPKGMSAALFIDMGACRCQCAILIALSYKW